MNFDGTRSSSSSQGMPLLMNFLRKLFGIFRLQAEEVRPQRMCPFCGLITPRAKSFCLECKRPLRPIQAERETAR